METICKTPAEASKKIRIELKAAFPSIKFSVRTETYSMGSSINISWTNGPTDKAVCAIVKKYEYGRFDGMTDSSSVEETFVSMPNGEVAYLGGAKHVFTRREISEAIVTDAEKAICGFNNVEHAGPNTPVMGDNQNPYWTANQIARRVLRASDLSNGYKGLRMVSQTEGRLGFEDRMDVISEGENATHAPVVEIPAEAAPEVVAAAQEIITHLGVCALTMRAEARRASIFHRCYIRYPAMDRQQVLRAVMVLLVAQVTQEIPRDLEEIANKLAERFSNGSPQMDAHLPIISALWNGETTKALKMAEAHPETLKWIREQISPVVKT